LEPQDNEQITLSGDDSESDFDQHNVIGSSDLSLLGRNGEKRSRSPNICWQTAAVNILNSTFGPTNDAKWLVTSIPDAFELFFPKDMVATIVTSTNLEGSQLGSK
jgi:hypothetical protein